MAPCLTRFSLCLIAYQIHYIQHNVPALLNVATIKSLMPAETNMCAAYGLGDVGAAAARRKAIANFIGEDLGGCCTVRYPHHVM